MKNAGPQVQIPSGTSVFIRLRDYMRVRWKKRGGEKNQPYLSQQARLVTDRRAKASATRTRPQSEDSRAVLAAHEAAVRVAGLYRVVLVPQLEEIASLYTHTHNIKEVPLSIPHTHTLSAISYINPVKRNKLHYHAV